MEGLEKFFLPVEIPSLISRPDFQQED